MKKSRFGLTKVAGVVVSFAMATGGLTALAQTVEVTDTSGTPQIVYTQAGVDDELAKLTTQIEDLEANGATQADITDVKAQITALESSKADLSALTALSNRVTTLETSVATLQANLTAEVSARQVAVATAKTEAINTAKTYTDGLINTEIAARALADLDLQRAITAEETARIASDDYLDLEITRVETKVDTQVARLDGRIDNLDAKVDTQVARAQAAEAQLQAKVANISTNGTTTTVTGDLSITGKLSIGGKDIVGTDAITSFGAADANGVIQIFKKNTLTGANVLAGSLDTLSPTEAQALVDVEEARALAAEAQLQNNINAEIAARTNADNALTTRVNGVDARVTAEIARAMVAEAQLQNNINAERTAREAAITAEANARIAADATLTTNLANEVTARQNADTALQNSINTEIAARIAGDVALEAKIDTVDAKVDREVSRLDGKIDAETQARIADVNRLTGYITDINERTQDLKRTDESTTLTRENAQIELARNIASIGVQVSDATGNGLVATEEGVAVGNVTGENSFTGLITTNETVSIGVVNGNEFTGVAVSGEGVAVKGNLGVLGDVGIDGNLAVTKDVLVGGEIMIAEKDGQAKVEVQKDINTLKSETVRIESESKARDANLQDQINSEVSRAKAEEKRLDKKFSQKDAVLGATIVNIIATELTPDSVKEEGITFTGTVGQRPDDQVAEVVVGVSKSLGDGFSVGAGVGTESGQVNVRAGWNHRVDEHINVGIGASVSERGFQAGPHAELTTEDGQFGAGVSTFGPSVIVGGVHVPVLAPQVGVANVVVAGLSKAYNAISEKREAPVKELKARADKAEARVAEMEAELAEIKAMLKAQAKKK